MSSILSMLVSLLLTVLAGVQGYKIRRTQCSLAGQENEVMVCTCGGLGDPYSIIMNKVRKQAASVPHHTL